MWEQVWLKNIAFHFWTTSGIKLKSLTKQHRPNQREYFWERSHGCWPMEDRVFGKRLWNNHFCNSLNAAIVIKSEDWKKYWSKLKQKRRYFQEQPIPPASSLKLFNPLRMDLATLKSHNAPTTSFPTRPKSRGCDFSILFWGMKYS